MVIVRIIITQIEILNSAEKNFAMQVRNHHVPFSSQVIASGSSIHPSICLLCFFFCQASNLIYLRLQNLFGIPKGFSLILLSYLSSAKVSFLAYQKETSLDLLSVSLQGCKILISTLLACLKISE